MRIKTLALMALTLCVALTACDDTTDSLGTSLTDNTDLLNVTTDTFDVYSRSMVSGAVLSRNTTGYLGKIRDPETGNYITGNFMTQFNTLENYNFPNRDSLVTVIDGDTVRGIVRADSCHVRLFYTSYYGDSLATMNLTAYELETPMGEGVKYYSDFNPKDYVRTNGGIKINKTYTMVDQSVSAGNKTSSSTYTPNIKLLLNGEYTDKDGVTYNNYGTYVMSKYYENPTNFKNSYNFIHDVCPGFYFEMNDGLGSMAYVTVSQLNVYFKYANDTTYVGTSSFAGTEEVLQTTSITNDARAIEELASDQTCSYLKTPAGIFTELELPIEKILRGHENDTINSAKVVLTRLNNDGFDKFDLPAPSTLLMIPKDSLYSFFENENVVDYKKSYLASFSSSSNNYTFNNISGMIMYMADLMRDGMAKDPGWLDDERNKDWKKVVIIPVATTYNTSGQIVNVVHDMSLTSTKLVKGELENSPIKISVIYSKFNE